MRNQTLTFFLGTLLLMSYTNCSKGFSVQNSFDSASQASSGSGETGGPVQPPVNLPPPQPPIDTRPVLKVCPSGCEYSLPSQALSVLKDREVIEIYSGDYKDCLSIRNNQVTVRGVGPTKPHLHSLICDGKGIITNYGTQNSIENLELSDFSNGDYNGAAIRQDVLAKDVILSKLTVHDGQMGVLGGSAGDRVWIDQSEFYNVGLLRPDGEISVPVFISAGALLQIRASKFTSSVDGSSFIKARTAQVSIDCSTIANLETVDSYSVDYQTGGQLSITNSVIEQSDRTANSTIVALNSVSFDPGITNSLTLKGNLFLNDANRGIFVNIFRDTPSNIQIENNIFVGSGTILNKSLPLSPSNQVLSARTASMGVYPSLPTPGSCLTATPAF